MIKNLLIVVSFLIALGLASGWSYKIGLSESQSFEALKFIVLVRKQHKCIESEDIECASKVNKLMAGVTAAQLKRTDTSALSQADRKGVDEFLVWERNLNEEQK